jgi:short-subunit dehydrogenase
VVYCPTKSFVRDFSEGLDYELRGTGVRSICICPGGTTTEFSDVAGQKIRPGKDMMFMSAERCAGIAVRKMLAGRRTVITGFMNVLGMWLLRFVPRAWMPWLAERTMSTTVYLPGRS